MDFKKHLKKKKYRIITFGCQMNKSDSERIEGLLLDMGMKPAKRDGDADLIILNTCSVRQSAEDRIYGAIRNFNRLKKQNSRVLIAVTGCMAGRDKDGAIRKKVSKEGKKDMAADFFFPISDLSRLPEMIFERWAPSAKREIPGQPMGSRRHNTIGLTMSNSKKMDYLEVKPKAAEWWRGWAVVQTGCSNYCAYCVVPFSRGREKNRPVAAILKEVREMARAGAKEINLLGQAVNSHPKFVEILEEVNKIPGVNRVSFSSAHPMHMTDEIIKALKLPKMMNYLHLPVQSGNNDIIKKMNRNYTREKYLKIIAKIKKARPGIALATDIIVGFPGETKRQFADTVALYKKCDFDMSYNAMYSPRTGTAAFRAFPDDVPQEEKRRRWRVLQNLMEKNVLRKNKKFLNKTVEVLIDGCKNYRCWGFSREYKKISFPGGKNLIGQVVNVKIKKAQEWELEGVLVVGSEW